MGLGVFRLGLGLGLGFAYTLWSLVGSGGNRFYSKVLSFGLNPRTGGMDHFVI